MISLPQELEKAREAGYFSSIKYFEDINADEIVEDIVEEIEEELKEEDKSANIKLFHLEAAIKQSGQGKHKIKHQENADWQTKVST